MADDVNGPGEPQPGRSMCRLERIEASGKSSDRLALLHAQGVTRMPVTRRSAADLRKVLGTPLPASTRILDELLKDRAE